MVQSGRIDCFPCIRLRSPIGLYDRITTAGEGIVTKFMRRVYAPTLLQTEVKQAVLVMFGGMLLLAVAGIQRIQLGLDQRLALPAESYLVLEKVIAAAVESGAGRLPITSDPPERNAGNVKIWSATW